MTKKAKTAKTKPLSLTFEQIAYAATAKYHRLYRDFYVSPDVAAMNREELLAHSERVVAGELTGQWLRKPLDEQYASVANHLLLMLGTGIQYVPGGFFGGYPGMTARSPALQPVVLDKTYAWCCLFPDFSPIYKIAGLDRSPPFVNDSFVALAFNIARCITLYGTDTRGNSYYPKNHGVNQRREASKVLKALKHKYPDKIPENCRKIR